MVLVEVACNKCGLVRLPIKKFSLFVDEKSDSFFTFICPSCGDINKYTADDYIVEVLTFNGILPHVWQPAKELFEIKKGNKLNLDDLLDLHISLQNDEWYEQLLKETKRK